MKTYSVLPVLTEHGERFSIAVTEDGAPERRVVDVVFSSRAEAEAAVKRLAQSDGSRPAAKP
jgi:hypothetical protein